MYVIVVHDTHSCNFGVPKDFGAASLVWKEGQATEGLPVMVRELVGQLQQVRPVLPLMRIEVRQAEPGAITMLSVSAEAGTEFISRQTLPVLERVCNEEFPVKVIVDSDDQAHYEKAVEFVMNA